MSIPIAFIICTEPGRLEGQSLMLAESIRKYCGKLKDTPIYSFHPRVGEPISKQTQQAFEALQVIHQQFPINREFQEYYLANKPLVCAYAEQNIDAEILVFLDNDKCFFSEPNEFLLPLNCNVRIRPEYGQGIGSTGLQDPKEWYWQKLYEILGVKHEVFVNTPIGNKRIRAYWNSGLVVVRRSAGIFTTWKDNFEKVMRLDITPLQGIYFVEQSVLSVTLCALEENVEHLPPNYSYPLPLHNDLSTELKIKDWDDIISIQYFNLFFYNDWNAQIQRLQKININSEKYRWLCQEVLFHNAPKMQAFYTKVQYTHIDSMPLMFIGKLLGFPMKREQRATYADWICYLIAEAANKGWRVLYLGSKPGVAEQGASILRQRFPGLQIACTHGYIGMDKDSQENLATLAAINAYKPHVLMVGIGMPRQEYWISENLEHIHTNTILTSRACMDYVAGAIPTPAHWMAKVGLEWLYHLLCEPKRLWRRYLLEPWFVNRLFLRKIWSISSQQKNNKYKI